MPMATSGYGRFYIKRVIQKAQDAGFKVLYSDTDSVFLTLDGKTKEDSEKFAEKINAELPGLMELEYEGFYPSGIFVSAKFGPYGAKKKYALIAEDGNLKIKGFETVKRNPNKTALLYKKEGVYFPITYKELAQKIKIFSAALQKLGLEKGDNVAILSENRPEWVISDISIMASGAITGTATSITL